MTCKDCKFWLAAEDSKTGLCRRFPPQMIASVYTLGQDKNAGRYNDEIYSASETEWPTTGSDEWCGEYINVNFRGIAIIR